MRGGVKGERVMVFLCVEVVQLENGNYHLKYLLSKLNVEEQCCIGALNENILI